MCSARPREIINLKLQGRRKFSHVIAYQFLLKKNVIDQMLKISFSREQVKLEY